MADAATDSSPARPHVGSLASSPWLRHELFLQSIAKTETVKGAEHQALTQVPYSKGRYAAVWGLRSKQQAVKCGLTVITGARNGFPQADFED